MLPRANCTPASTSGKSCSAAIRWASSKWRIPSPDESGSVTATTPPSKWAVPGDSATLPARSVEIPKAAGDPRHAARVRPLECDGRPTRQVFASGPAQPLAYDRGNQWMRESVAVLALDNRVRRHELVERVEEIL